jgi:hypothetical protein
MVTGLLNYLRLQLYREEPQVPPLRCAPVGMTKGRAVLPGKVVAEQEPFFITLSAPQAHDSSGRDDSSIAERIISRSSFCGHNRIVIPTGAYPDFLLRAASDDHVCGSP